MSTARDASLIAYDRLIQRMSVTTDDDMADHDTELSTINRTEWMAGR